LRALTLFLILRSLAQLEERSEASRRIEAGERPRGSARASILRDASLRDAPQHEGLGSLFNCQTARPKTRVIAPCKLWPQGKPSHSSSICSNRACGTLWQEAASATAREPGGQPPRRSRTTALGQWPSLNAWARSGRTGASEAVSHLRSARGWICRLAGCPGVKSFRPRSPFVRAVARTGTRAVRSLRRRLPPPSLGQTGPRDICGPATLRTSAPRSPPRRRSQRAPCRYGTAV